MKVGQFKAYNPLGAESITRADMKRTRAARLLAHAGRAARRPGRTVGGLQTRAAAFVI